MRVLHVMKGSEAIFGAERVIFAEMEHQRRHGIDARFLMFEELRSGDKRDVMGAYAEERSIPVIRVQVSGRVGWDMIRRARDAMREADAQVIHTHSYKGDVIGFAGARLAGIPVVGEIHGWLFPKHDYLIRFYEWLDAQVLKRMDRVVVLADQYRRMILDMGFSPQRIDVVPSGVDIDALRNRAGKVDIRRRLGIAEDAPVIGTLTRLSPEKGVDLFIRSIALIAHQRPEVRGVIFGMGPQEQELKKLADELGVAGQLVWAGYVEEAMDALRACDVVAQTSRYEALPQTLMEAMVMARPVVVTPVGGCPELVVDGETGYVVPSLEAELIAACLCKLLDHPEHAEEMGQAGAMRIAQHYSMERWVARMQQVYQQACNGRADRD